MSQRERVFHKVEGDSLTQQNFAQEADINAKMSQYMKGPGRMGLPIGNPMASRKPMFGDFSNIDYHAMLNTVTQIDSMFHRLPARLRGRFRNRPELLLEWVSNPDNRKEAVKMGLIVDADLMDEIKQAEQMDIEKESKKAAEAKEDAARAEVPKADPESQPSYAPPKGGKKA